MCVYVCVREREVGSVELLTRALQHKSNILELHIVSVSVIKLLAAVFTEMFCSRSHDSLHHVISFFSVCGTCCYFDGC